MTRTHNAAGEVSRLLQGNEWPWFWLNFATVTVLRFLKGIILEFFVRGGRHILSGEINFFDDFDML
ncbi:hypothetical protein [Micromonospora tulbaghiae]|uniref:hypothetical protein n=1 Tax=Micromonospora tulbaghiae TaxID=479978 RepID=UPI0033E2D844